MVGTSPAGDGKGILVKVRLVIGFLPIEASIDHDRPIRWNSFQGTDGCTEIVNIRGKS
jgi:hypothetical protein